MKVIRNLYIVLYLVLLFTLQAFAQNKKLATTEDYSKWYHIEQSKVSNDGSWFAHVRSNKRSGMYLVRMEDNKEEFLDDVLQFDFTEDSNFLIVQGNKQSFLRDLKTNKETKLSNLKTYYLLKDKHQMLLKYDNSTAIMDIRTGKQQIFKEEQLVAVQKQKEWALVKKEVKGTMRWFAWHFSSGIRTEINGLEPSLENIRLDDKSQSLMGIYPLASDKKDIQIAFNDGKGWKVEKMSEHLSQVSLTGSWYFLDGEKNLVYFYSENKAATVSDAKVEVRNSLNRDTSQPAQFYNSWNFKTGAHHVFYRDGMTAVLATSIEGYYIGYSIQNYDVRDYRGIDKADFYLLKENEPPLLIEKEVIRLSKHFLIHQTKPYAVYFKDGHWWSYHFITKNKVCLTTGHKDRFFDFDKIHLSDSDHLGVLGFTENKEELLLYDKFDLWKLDLKGSYLERCTNGKDNGITYRYSGDARLFDNQFRDTWFNIPIVDTAKLLLKGRNALTFETAVALVNGNCEMKQIAAPEKFRILYTKSLENNKHLLVRENHHTPRQYVIMNNSSEKPLIYQTNKHHKEYGWGKMQLFNIPLSDGTNSQASLIYPAQWNPGKKYPTVVYYYEKTAPYAMYYTIPEFDNVDGFNSTLLSQKNFFVLYIDMRYQDGKVTKYLVSDTNEVVDYILNKEPTINSKKLGMVGHSFGGFEVMYLAGKTDRFKAAVAGAGISDLTDYYYADKDQGSLGMFAAENVQMKMMTPYNDRTFHSLSPLSNIFDINTPMLIWSGENDYRIRKEHSIKMYLGLWRQKKEAELLIYKDEEHYLLNPENMKDLTNRIIAFFEEKLK